MTKHLAITETELTRIVGLLQRRGWTVRPQSGPTLSFVGYPVNPRHTPVVISGRGGLSALYRDLRIRGIEADPRRVSRRKRRTTTDPADLAVLVGELETARYEPRPTKPLPSTVSEWARSFAWDTHAIDRVQERGVGVFEVYAALDFPDYVTEAKRFDRRQDIRCHFRGDVIVCVDTTHRRILTVMLTESNVRTVPRVPLLPDVPTPRTGEESTVSTPDQSVTTDPADPADIDTTPHSDQPGDDTGASETEVAVPSPGNQSQQIYAWLAAKPRNFTFATAELSAALPHIPQGTISSAFHRVKGIRPELVRATPERGVYRVWNPAGIAALITGRTYVTTPAAPTPAAPTPAAPTPAAPTPAAPTPAVERGGHRAEVRELIASLKPGDELTTPFIANMLGVDREGRRGIRTVLDEAEQRGELVSTSGPDRNSVRIFRLPDSTPATPAAPAEPVTPAEPVAVAEAGPVVVTAPVLTFEADPDDVDVTLGFVFEKLPASDIYDMADLIREHYADLQAHPGGTFRLAEYAGTDPLGTAEKRAVLLADHMDDGCLRFVARRRGDHHAGLYVSWSRG